MERLVQHANGDDHEKLVVGWFSFTCCEDSTILLTELLNDHLDEWKKVVEFRHMKALKTSDSLSGLDVAFVEGAISSDAQAEEVQRIRENAKYVVAIGTRSCATPIARCSWCAGRERAANARPRRQVWGRITV
jgi:coenzyme F420-reducing hydrogenase gamma subunit